MNNIFRTFAQFVASKTGKPATFALAIMLIILWGFSGPIFGYSDTWQLMINTTTTIVTFLMVFLIQNTQNRDSKAIHLKLDELVKANKAARNMLLDIEAQSDEEIESLEGEFKDLHDKHVVSEEKKNNKKK
jgi:low affinity Fe/Cu permease